MFFGLPRVSAFTAACAVGAGCAQHAAPAPINRAKTVFADIKRSSPAPRWGARFVSPVQLVACRDLDSAKRVCFGELGERWLDGPAAAIASPYLAPESLVAMVRTPGGQFVYVGEHGGRFLSTDELGPFVASQPATQRYSGFQIVGDRWYGQNREGELWTGVWPSRDGQRVALQGPVLDFAMGASGRGLAVTLPERLWITQDQGQSWQLLHQPPLGIRRVSADSIGHLKLTAVLADQLHSDGFTVEGTAPATDVAAPRLHHDPAIWADARAMELGRATFLTEQWYELTHRDDGWYFAWGRFDQPLQLDQVPALKACSDVRLSVHSATAAALCLPPRDQEPSSRVTLHIWPLRHLDKRVEYKGELRGPLKDIRLQLLDPARAIVTGAASPLPGASASSRPHVAQLLNRKQWHSETPVVPLMLSWTPNAEGRLHAEPISLPATRAEGEVAVSDDGRDVAFIARATPAGPLQLLLSSDGGRNFAAHSIEGAPVTAEPRLAQLPNRRGPSDATLQVKSLAFGDDRSLALVAKDGDAPIIYNFDSSGGLVATSLAPPEVSQVGAAGTRILAMSMTQRHVYQSLDRGASFELVGHLPAAACLPHMTCPIICRSAGCIVGDRFTRSSWGTSPDKLDFAYDDEERVARAQPVTARVMLRPSLMCRLASSQSTPVPRAPSAGDMGWTSELWQLPLSAAARCGVRARRGGTTIEQVPCANGGTNLGATYEPQEARTWGPIGWPLPAIEAVWHRFKNGWSVFALDDSRSLLLRATHSALPGTPMGAWQIAARTIASGQQPMTQREYNRLAKGPSGPVLLLATAASGRQLTDLTVFPLTSDEQLLGAPFSVQLPHAFDEPPARCTARDRQTLVRVSVPLLPDAARGVALEDDRGALQWLVATHATLFAGPKRTCVDSLWAETLPGLTSANAVIALDDLDHAWFFRAGSSGEARKLARRVQCAFDMQAAPPPETESRLQARWNLGQLFLEQP